MDRADFRCLLRRAARSLVRRLVSGRGRQPSLPFRPVILQAALPYMSKTVRFEYPVVDECHFKAKSVRSMASANFRRRLLIALIALGLGACGRDSSEVTHVAVIGAEPKLVETVSAPLSAGDAQIRSNMAQGLVRFD